MMYCMISGNIVKIVKFGPRLVSKGPKNRAMIYLPKEYSWLRGKYVFVTLEVLEFKEKN